MSFNYVDGMIALLLLLFVATRARRGFFVLTADFATLVLSVLAAFLFHSPVAGILQGLLAVPESYADALGFLIVIPPWCRWPGRVPATWRSLVRPDWRIAV